MRSALYSEYVKRKYFKLGYKGPASEVAKAFAANAPHIKYINKNHELYDAHNAFMAGVEQASGEGRHDNLTALFVRAANDTGNVRMDVRSQLLTQEFLRKVGISFLDEYLAPLTEKDRKTLLTYQLAKARTVEETDMLLTRGADLHADYEQALRSTGCWWGTCRSEPGLRGTAKEAEAEAVVRFLVAKGADFANAARCPSLSEEGHWSLKDLQSRVETGKPTTIPFPQRTWSINFG